MSIKPIVTIDKMRTLVQVGGRNIEQDIKDFVKSEIDNYIKSPSFKLILDSHRYYVNDNTEILNRKKMVYDLYGKAVEDKRASNYKIAHPFVYEMVEQKLNFLFNTKPTVAGVSDDNFFSNRRMNTTRELATNAVLEGLTWSHVTYNERGELEEIPVTALEIIPFWKDNRTNMLEGLIRFYTVDKYTNGKKTIRMLIEYYVLNEDEKGFSVHFYYRETEEKNGSIKYSDSVYSDLERQYYNFKLMNLKGESVDDLQEIHFTYDRIPYVPYRYNKKGIPLLKFMKPSLDTYDFAISDLMNAVPDSMRRTDVFTGYGGISAAQHAENRDKHDIILLDQDGEYQSEYANINAEVLKLAIQESKENIYNAGNGVDVKSLIASNTSQETIRLRFEEVLQDVRNIAREFSGSLELVYQYYKLDEQVQGFKNTLDEVAKKGISIDLEKPEELKALGADIPEFMLSVRNAWEEINWSVMLPIDIEIILKLATILSKEAVLSLIDRMNLGIDIEGEIKQYKTQQEGKLQAYINVL